MPAAIMLGEGDGLAVAGLAGKDGVFKGYAYRNLDTGASGRSCGIVHLFLGMVAASIGFVAGLVALLGVLATLTGNRVGEPLGLAAFASVFALAFGIGGFKALRQFIRTSRAVGALR